MFGQHAGIDHMRWLEPPGKFLMITRFAHRFLLLVIERLHHPIYTILITIIPSKGFGV